MDWQTLSKLSLVGTDRQIPPAPVQADPVTQVLAQFNWQTPETALLSTAATLAWYQQVGQEAATATSPLPTACDLADQTRIPATLDQALGRILREWNEFGILLPELLQLMAQAQLRVSEVYLPQLLQMGVKQKVLRPAIIAVLGQRGQWLAAQNPKWRYAAAKPKTNEKKVASSPIVASPISPNLLTQWQLQPSPPSADFFATHWQTFLSSQPSSNLEAHHWYQWLQSVVNCPSPWPDDFSQALLAYIEKTLANLGNNPHQTKTYLTYLPKTLTQSLALALPLTLTHSLTETMSHRRQSTVANDSPVLTTFLEQVLLILQFRQSIHQSII